MHVHLHTYLYFHLNTCAVTNPPCTLTHIHAEHYTHPLTHRHLRPQGPSLARCSMPWSSVCLCAHAHWPTEGREVPREPGWTWERARKCVHPLQEGGQSSKEHPECQAEHTSGGWWVAGTPMLQLPGLPAVSGGSAPKILIWLNPGASLHYPRTPQGSGEQRCLQGLGKEVPCEHMHMHRVHTHYHTPTVHTCAWAHTNR